MSFRISDARMRWIFGHSLMITASKVLRGLDQARAVVAWMMNADQAVHLFMRVAVPRGELIADDVQDEKVHPVGVVDVCRVPFRLHVCAIVVQDIVDVVRFVLVRADDARIDRHWFNTSV